MPDYRKKIKHIIVLMLENRSFDHMLGFLKHEKSAYPGLSGEEYNPVDPRVAPGDSNYEIVKVNGKAKPELCLGPPHNHNSVMKQLFGHDREEGYPKPYKPTNKGFIWEYENHFQKKKRINKKKCKIQTGQGKEIMKCFKEDEIPVLAKLAKEFAVCVRWFCSVPGETWPNRNFTHAATSHGEVDIRIKFYKDKTIFQLLQENKKEWKIYHDGVAQAMAFPKLWAPFWRGNFRKMKSFYDAIKENKLPHYSFIEPRHYPLLKDYSNNQHPNRNEKNGRNFLKGEQLIGKIYNALISNEEVWNKTLFIITYDEHGGFFDRFPPPYDPERFCDGFTAEENNFKFDLLGPRVPAIVISPYIEKGTIDFCQYDHTSIIKTILETFEIKLTDKDKKQFIRAENAHDVLHNLKHQARTVDAVEEGDRISKEKTALYASSMDTEAESISPKLEELDCHTESLFALAYNIKKCLDDEVSEKVDILSEDMELSDQYKSKLKEFNNKNDMDDFVDNAIQMLEDTAERGLTLRTTADESIEKPTVEQLGEEIDNLKNKKKEDEGDLCFYVEDRKERIITTYNDGRIVFIDPNADKKIEGKSTEKSKILDMLTLLENGQLEELEKRLTP